MKSILRNKMLLVRKNISNKEKKSTIIVDKILNLDIYKKSNVIAIYNSMNSEVNTKRLIDDSLNKKIVLLPRIANNKMVFIKINNNTEYTKSNFGVIEPLGNEYIGKIDLIIVPGISFDKQRNRLGYGKGYYDKYLRNNNIYKIGICFDEQIIDNLPINDLDIPMNLVITDKKKI